MVFFYKIVLKNILLSKKIPLLETKQIATDLQECSSLLNNNRVQFGRV